MPRKETIEREIFRFEELDDDAKQHAKDDYAANFGYNWADEYIDSIRALAEHFGYRMENYEIDFFNCSHSSARFDNNDDPPLTKKEIRSRLAELGTYNRRTLRGNGDCKLTGFCGDEAAIDGFRMAFIREKITDVEELLQHAFDSAVKEAQGDCEWQYTDEIFAEHCEANDYEFDEKGRIV